MIDSSLLGRYQEGCSTPVRPMGPAVGPVAVFGGAGDSDLGCLVSGGLPNACYIANLIKPIPLINTAYS